MLFVACRGFISQHLQNCFPSAHASGCRVVRLLYLRRRLDDDLISLLRKRCYDLAGTAGTAVYWNGMRLPVRNFVEYVDLYLGESPSRKRGSKSKGGGRKKRKKKGSDGESSDSTGEGTENDTETAQDGDKENERPPERQTIKIHEKMHRWEVVISQTGRSRVNTFIRDVQAHAA